MSDRGRGEGEGRRVDVDLDAVRDMLMRDGRPFGAVVATRGGGWAFELRPREQPEGVEPRPDLPWEMDLGVAEQRRAKDEMAYEEERAAHWDWFESLVNGLLVRGWRPFIFDGRTSWAGLPVPVLRRLGAAEMVMADMMLRGEGQAMTPGELAVVAYDRTSSSLGDISKRPRRFKGGLLRRIEEWLMRRSRIRRLRGAAEVFLEIMP